MSTEPQDGQAAAKSTKYVYFFGGGMADGNGKMKDVLGGKGAGLAEMTNAGLPVPPGFTIQTEACREYMRHNAVSKEVDSQMQEALAKVESTQGQKLGKGENPLLVSVRSGAKFSMPGMMDTILNLGLNDQSVETLTRRTNNPRFAYDSYRRLIQIFGHVVLGIERSEFEEVYEGKKKQEKVKFDTELDAKALKEVIAEYKKVIKKHAQRDFPQNPYEQLVMARDAVFRSWNNDRAKHYRRINNISDDLGTAVNVQAMVNFGDTSGTGVGFTRNPATGAKEFYGEFLLNAQGDDMGSGVRTSVPFLDLETIMPDVYNQLRDLTRRLETHYKDIQDFEFTIQEGTLYMLQTRNGKRTGTAAVRIAIDLVEEGLIAKEEAIFRVDPSQLCEFLVPRFDEKGLKAEDVLAVGLPVSPGAAVGQIVFTANEAIEKGHGKKVPVILVMCDMPPEDRDMRQEDIDGLEAAEGVLTQWGGMRTVTARAMGKSCVTCPCDVDVNEKAREMRVRGQVFKEGDWISLDGTTGRLIKGKLNTLPPTADDPELLKFMAWADSYRTMKVRANADTPRDAIQARALGAEGIGLCRTEHMFFGEQAIPHTRAMILADSEKERRTALNKLLPLQRNDFISMFRAMDGFPVTIRTLDPPLHEFLPSREQLMVDIATHSGMGAKERKELVAKYKGYGAKEAGDLKELLPKLLKRVEQLHEFNPMLGHRGCRLGITYPAITELQARAIFEAAVAVAKDGVKVYRKRLSNTSVRMAGSVLKCPDDRKNRVVSAQATFTSGGSAIGGRFCEQRYAAE